MTDDGSLAGRRADERLLGEGAERPASLGAPQSIPVSPRRARIVAAGVALTGGSLVLGLVLLVLGIVLLIGRGAGAVTIGTLAVGGVLVATHWGWVHVAELAGGAAQERYAAPAVAGRQAWLDAIEPYARTEVSTEVADDGAIAVVRTRFTPVAGASDAFAFTAERTVLRTMPADAPSAEVAEVAELARRDAAAETERERRAYAELASDRAGAALAAGDEAETAAARRAASRALSERINERLAEPPLSE